MYHTSSHFTSSFHLHVTDLFSSSPTQSLPLSLLGTCMSCIILQVCNLPNYLSFPWLTLAYLKLMCVLWLRSFWNCRTSAYCVCVLFGVADKRYDSVVKFFFRSLGYIHSPRPFFKASLMIHHAVKWLGVSKVNIHL